MSPLLSSNRYSAEVRVSEEPAQNGYRPNPDLMRLSHLRQVSGRFGTLNLRDRASGIGLRRQDCSGETAAAELQRPARMTGTGYLNAIAARDV